MSESNRIAELIARVVSGDPWHGDSVSTTLAGVPAAAAASRPIAGAHSVWELLLHMTGWAEEVDARLRGKAAGEPPAGDWPAPDATNDAEWDRVKARFFAAHTALAATVRTVPDAALDAPVLDTRSRADGTGLPKYVTAHGLVHHTVYHAGQIALLRKAFKA